MIRISKQARRVETSSAVAISGIVVAAVLAMSGCADMDPSTRGAGTGAAVGSGIALVAGGSAGAVIGGGLIGGGLGYAGGWAAGNPAAARMSQTFAS